MALEIERKFRVTGDGWQAGVVRVRPLRQAYLAKGDKVSLRVRIDGEETASLTIKTARAGVERSEYEYEIPVGDALELLEQRTGAIVAKRRHVVPLDGVVWEIDVFEGDNAGLIIAEVELSAPDEAVPRPSWIGKEVTHDSRFYNAELAIRPYASWQPAAATLPSAG